MTSGPLLRLCVTLPFLLSLAPAGRTAPPRDDGIREHLDLLRRENARLEQFTLPNGMRCLLKADRSAPVASVQIWIGSGSVHEEQFLGAGIAHAVEHMLFKGTPALAPGELTRLINAAGGRVNAYTTFDRTVYFADLPSRHWKTAFDALSDAVMHAHFPEAEWALERDVIFREIAMDEDNPERVLGRHLWQTALRVHPFRHPVIGYPDAFASLTRDDLQTFFNRHYTPDNMLLVIVGDIDTAAVQRHVAAVFEDFRRRPRAPVLLPPEPPQRAARRTRITGDYRMGRLAAAWPSVTLHHPDAPALDILAAVAGQGRSSRLHRNLVEDHRVLLSVGAWSFTPGEPGLFGISATFDPEREDEALAAFQVEVDHLKTIPFTLPEIRKAVRTALTGQLGELATMSGQAARYGADALFTGDPYFSEAWLQQILAITPEDLLRVAREYLPADARSLALLMPAGKTGSATAATAPVEAAPPLQRLVLDNGTLLLVRENHRLPFVHIAVALKGGLRAETGAQHGITVLMAQLLTRGTATRSREETAMAVESLGATLDPYAGLNAFGLTAQALSGDAETLVGVLADCLLHPLFEESEIARQRELQLAAIHRQQERPMFVAQQQLRDMIFPGHPYRHIPEGSPESVVTITRDDLIAHHRRLVTAGNLTVSIFGNITADAAARLANAVFSAIPDGPEPLIAIHTEPPALPARATRELPREQAILLAGFPAVALDDPRYDALNVLQTAMSGLASELALEVRDRRGLAYFTGAQFQAGLDPGLFALYAGTRRDAVEEVEALFHAELRRLTEFGLRDDELGRAQAQLIAGHEMRLQDQLSIALECALHERYGLGGERVFMQPDRISRVTAEDIRTAAAEILDVRRMAVSIILPAGKDATPPDGK